ncbi:amidase [Svornostia abyssi]|uniref:Amidase n=1 Tax=Svornostia abyssi TaxID=2898438 RepID=A0ABY5P9Z9_9ACTN|nr:amidase [Parviterribacteraceae bacterium J379]
MRFDEYAVHDGLGLAQLVREGDVTATELLETAQARAAAVNPRINAIVRWMSAEAQARAVAPLPGAFGGVPFLLKDLFQEYAGVTASGGCRALANIPAEAHATVTQRWLDAGLVPFGRTNTPEFGSKAITEPDLHGPCRNPWDLQRTPGGSSGGSAAAVAAGIVPVAGASDGGGSIRIPAACCGLFGLKPGRGLIPNGPALGEPLQGSATNGVLSRSVRDTAAMLDVLAGMEPTSPFAPWVPDGPFLDEVGRAPGVLRIGVQTTCALRDTLHPEATRAVEDAASLLAELGHEVEIVPAPVDERALARDFLTTWFVEGAYIIDDIRRRTGAGRDGFELDSRVMADLGRVTSSIEHCAAIERRHDYVTALASFFSRFDLLLTPTLAEPPVRVGSLATPKPMQLAAKLMLALRATRFSHRLGVVEDLIDKNLSWVPFTQLANVTGRPAMSVPLHWTAEDVPLGVQFVAPLRGEATLLRLAAQLEQARPWSDRRPPASRLEG